MRSDADLDARVVERHAHARGILVTREQAIALIIQSDELTAPSACELLDAMLAAYRRRVLNVQIVETYGRPEAVPAGRHVA